MNGKRQKKEQKEEVQPQPQDMKMLDKKISALNPAGNVKN